MNENSKPSATALSCSIDSVPMPRSEPLYVDMDGTLLATDTLWESFIRLAKVKPLLMLRVPFWLIKGKAFFKRQVASRTSLNPSLLPYNQAVMDFLRLEQQKGRKIILATASDRRVADRVARHVGLFSEVIATDGELNLSGHAKLSAIVHHANGSAFDYVGNSWADVPIWEKASKAILVQPSKRMLAKVAQTSSIEVLPCPDRSSKRTLFRTLRVHQWAKNVLLLVPLLLAHRISDPKRLLDAFMAFVAFSLAASSVYVVNDVLDLENDRQHPKKRTRPLAAGLISIPLALTLAFLAMTVSFGIAGAMLPLVFVGMLLLYQATTMMYSFYLKRIAILDVLVLAGLYAMRVLAGAVAVDVPVSPWFLAFSIFLFLSLAFVKRYGELRMAGENGEANGFLNARGYQPGDLDLLRSVGAASGYVAVAVFALYINSGDVHVLYQRPVALWLIGPLILYWITRVWFLAHRGLMHDDPIVFAITDRHSYFIAGIIAILLLVATIH